MIIIQCFAYNMCVMYCIVHHADGRESAVELYTYQLDNVAIFCSDIELHAL